GAAPRERYDDALRPGPERDARPRRLCRRGRTPAAGGAGPAARRPGAGVEPGRRRGGGRCRGAAPGPPRAAPGTGRLLAISRFSNRSLMPIILLLYGTPQITILPLFILYFGIGPPSKIAFGVTHGVFPIIVTIVAGVQNIKPILMTAAHSMGASRWQIFRWVIFPHMIPSFFAGMR